MQCQQPDLLLDTLDDLVRVIDETRPALTNGPMASGAGSRVHTTWNREHLTAIVFGGQTCGDHRSTPKPRLEDDHAKRKSRDDSIPLRKPSRPRSCVAWILTQHDASLRGDRLKERGILRRIEVREPGAEHGNGRPSTPKRGSMRRRIDSNRTSRTDRVSGFAKGRREPRRQIDPDRGTSPGTDDGDDRVVIEDGWRSQTSKRHRRVVDPGEQCGVIGIEERHDRTAQSLEMANIRPGALAIKRTDSRRRDQFRLARHGGDRRHRRVQDLIDRSKRPPQSRDGARPPPFDALHRQCRDFPFVAHPRSPRSPRPPLGDRMR